LVLTIRPFTSTPNDTSTSLDRAKLELTSKYFAGGLPDVLQCYEPDAQAQLVITFAALLQYLGDLKIDTHVVASGTFVQYQPATCGEYLVLDGQTLTNLEILENGHDRSVKGSLLQFVDQCVTPFGKRQIRKMVCRPLIKKTAIEERLDAIENLHRVPDLMGMINNPNNLNNPNNNNARPTGVCMA
jgi:DNA mismatch repair ATPase MutS